MSLFRSRTTTCLTARAAIHVRLLTLLTQILFLSTLHSTTHHATETISVQRFLRLRQHRQRLCSLLIQTSTPMADVIMQQHGTARLSAVRIQSAPMVWAGSISAMWKATQIISGVLQKHSCLKNASLLAITTSTARHSQKQARRISFRLARSCRQLSKQKE